MGLFDKLFGKKPLVEQTKSNPEKSERTDSRVIKPTFNPDIPAYQGDYAKTVFLNAYAKASPIKAVSDYQSYLLYECGIKDAAAFHKSLISEGLLQESTITDRIAGLKVADLKMLLSELGQPSAGKKDALVQRAAENCSVAILQKYCPQVTYSVSEKGLTFLREHEDYIRIHTHRNWDVSWQEYDRRKRPGRSFNDTIWQIFNERVIQSSNYGRNEYLMMYQLLAEEKKQVDAILMLLRVICIDLSGSEGADYINMYRTGSFTLKELEDYFDVAIMLAPGLINDIPKYKDVYDDSFIEKVYAQELPIRVCSQQLFKDIIHSIINGTYDETTTKAKLKRAYNKYVGEIKGSK